MLRRKNMDYVIISFRSRAHTVKFAEILTNARIAMEIVNTPKEAGVGCGLSVKIRKEQFSIVKRYLERASLSSFAGFFLIKTVDGKRFVRNIY